MVKKIFIALALCGLSQGLWAQESIGDEKHSVATNSFWANWFVQAGVSATSFWGSQENKFMKPDKLGQTFRTNADLSLAVGKWFTPGIGLRTKLTGFWGRTVVSQNKERNASRFWTLDEQVLLNMSNMLMGYSEERLWNVIPYFGGGVGRSLSYNSYAMGLNVGLLNTFRLTPRLAANLDISYATFEPDLDGISTYGGSHHKLKNKDRMLSIELGLTYRLGNSTWRSQTNMEAMQALTQGEIDALNAQLSDLQAENERLNNMLQQQQGQQSADKASEEVSQ